MGISNVISAVTTVTGISYQEMRQKTRKREIVSARQWTMYFSDEHDVLTAQRFGQDRCTVIYAKKKKAELITVDKQSRYEHDSIYELINNDLIIFCVNCIQL